MKVAVIYVLYNPNFTLVKESLCSIKEGVCKYFVIDNSISDNSSVFREFDNVDYISNGSNLGIAEGQNVAIRKALLEDFDYVVLSDQDSIYPKNYIYNIMSVFNSFTNVCAVAPRFNDLNRPQGSKIEFYVPSMFGKTKDKSNDDNVIIYEAAASGMMIDVKKLVDIGGMKKELYIDWVDFEWCWRARGLGYKIIGSKKIIIHHHLGGKAIKIASKSVNSRNHIRHYYITRNAVYLSFRSKDLSLLSRLSMFLSAPKYVVGYPLIFKPRLLNLKYTLLGFYHGIIGRMGPFE